MWFTRKPVSPDLDQETVAAINAQVASAIDALVPSAATQAAEKAAEKAFDDLKFDVSDLAGDAVDDAINSADLNVSVNCDGITELRNALLWARATSRDPAQEEIFTKLIDALRGL